MLDIVLIVLGLGIIGSSYVISEKMEAGLQEKKAEELLQIKDIWTEKEEKKVRERIDSIVEERVGQAIDKTEDELSRISNEKIIVSNEFSEQVLGKIEKNHEEVVFLYNMLNEKEKQMKALMKEIETLRAAGNRMVEEEKTMTAVDRLEQMKKAGREQPKAKTAVQPAQAAEPADKDEDEKELSKLRAFAKSMEEKEETSKLQEQRMQQKTAELQKQQPAAEKIKEQPEKQTEGQKQLTKQEKILRLYKQGMSVLEISKALNMGQGEVKLIIDLFQGAVKQ